MADIKISDLQNTTMASDGSDLFEISQGQGGGSYLSRNITAAQIGNFVNAVQTYSGLGGMTPVAAIASKPNGRSVFSGTADPAAALGSDGDVYIKYNATTSTVIDVKMYKPTDAYTVEITISEGGNDLLFESNACSLFGGYSTVTDTFTTADGNSHTINSWGVEHRGDNDPSQFVEIDGTTISFVTTGMNSSYEIDETKTMTFAPPDKECVIYTKISGTWEEQIDTEDIKTLLSDLDDVNTSQLANGEVLVWNSTGGMSGNGGWENKAITADNVEYTSGVSVGDKLDEVEDNTIYKDGTYNLSGICFGYGSGSSGNPNGIFYLPKIIPANKTVTISNPSISLCRKYDGSNVAQTSSTASYSNVQNYVAVGGDVAIGYYVSCVMAVSFTMTIS